MVKLAIALPGAELLAVMLLLVSAAVSALLPLGANVPVCWSKARNPGRLSPDKAKLSGVLGGTPKDTPKLWNVPGVEFRMKLRLAILMKLGAMADMASVKTVPWFELILTPLVV